MNVHLSHFSVRSTHGHLTSYRVPNTHLLGFGTKSIRSKEATHQSSLQLVRIAAMVTLHYLPSASYVAIAVHGVCDNGIGKRMILHRKRANFVKRFGTRKKRTFLVRTLALFCLLSALTSNRLALTVIGKYSFEKSSTA